MGLDAGFCLAGDSASCAFLVYDVLAVATPGLPGSYGLGGGGPRIGVGGGAGRLARGADAGGAVGQADNFPVWSIKANRWRDPKTGQFTKTPDGYAVLDRSQINTTQNFVNVRFGKEGLGEGKTIGEVGRELIENDTFFPPAVFQKTSDMNAWDRLSETITRRGRYEGYLRNLEEGQIYTLNNRSLILANLLGMDKIPVRWVTDDSFIKIHTFQFQKSGGPIILRDRDTGKFFYELEVPFK